MVKNTIMNTTNELRATQKNIPQTVFPKVEKVVGAV
jgi:hypothetical protein